MPRSSSPSRSRTGAARRLAPVLALAAALGGCRCSEEDPSLLTVYTSVVYSRDGEALVLHATDGIYVSSPAGEGPRRLFDQPCASGLGLECVRASSDARRLLILAERSEAGEDALYKLVDVRVDARGERVEVPVAEGVLDAALSPDGAEVVFAKPGTEPGTFDLFHLAASGPEEIVHAVALDGAPGSAALDAVLVTPYGVAYPRAAVGSTALHYRPWGRPGYAIGKLSGQCLGPQLRWCAAANADGTALAWQETAGAIIHAFRTQTEVDLPLGQGYAFGFSEGGSLVLRMDGGPATVQVQSVETAVVERALLASAAVLSADGETLATLAQESKTRRTWRLSVGNARREGQDRELGVLEEPWGRPLLGDGLGSAPIGFALTGDARFVVLEAPPDAVGEEGTSLVSIHLGSGERRTLGTLTCTGCCAVAPVGALVVCSQGLGAGPILGQAPVDIYDPATGLKTHASDQAVYVEPLPDGGGLALLEYVGKLPELWLVTKDGRRESWGSALGFAVAPNRRQIAVIGGLGRLRVESLP